MNNLGNKETFSKNLEHYAAKNHKTRNDICDDLGFPYTTVTGWFTGTKYPRIDKIELLAKYFGVQKSDLIEEKPTTAADDELSNLDIQLIQMLPNLSDQEKRMFLAQVNAVLASRE